MGATTTLVTVQEFLQIPEPEGQRLELIGGEVVSMGRGGYKHEFTKSNIIRAFSIWLAQNPRARFFSESMFQVDADTAAIPDISIFLSGPDAPENTEIMQGAPELAIEVVSSESAARLETKVRRYLARGSKSVWVVFPELRIVRIYDPSGLSRTLEENQTLEDPIALPGFQVSAAALFEGI